MTNAFKHQLKKELGTNIKSVIDMLDVSLNIDSSIFNDFVLLKSRYSSLNSRYNNGVLSDENYNIGLNRIKQSLIHIIDRLEEDDINQNKIKQFSEKKSSSTPSSDYEVNKSQENDSSKKSSNDDTSSNDETPLKVFIAYSWDNDNHKAWILQLANKLVENGLDVLLDQYELGLGKNLTHFMEKSIESADKVLTIFTENYKLKAEGRAGGVGYEYSMINAELYQNQVNNNKIIPILRGGDSDSSIPKFIKAFIWLDMRDDSKFDENFMSLLREIYNEPKIKKPQIGKKPKFD